MLSRLPLVVCAALLSVTLRAAEPPILAKARAYLGSDAALAAVKSVHYTGTLVITDAEDPKQTVRATAEIIFQKPEQQRVAATYEKTADRAAYREVTALDGYEAWQQMQDLTDTTRWQHTLLGTEEVKGLRAITWENFGFYRGIENRGGRIEDLGDVTIEGVACRKIAFIYSPTVVFYRHFDAATGRLVVTETANGSTMKEDGEIVVQGVRYPKKITQTSRDGAGRPKILTTTFDTITLNEDFPASTFAVPPVPRPAAGAAKKS